MRHRKSGRKLGMNSSARKAMFRNMVTSLMLHGTIRTTEARAKELRRVADKVITLGKNAPSPAAIDLLEGDARQQARARRVHALRQAQLLVGDDAALDKVFGEYAQRFRTRPGGYTRVIRAGRRDGDNAEMAVVQLVEAYDPSAKAEEAAPAAEAAPAEEPAAAEEIEEEAEITEEEGEE